MRWRPQRLTASAVVCCLLMVTGCCAATAATLDDIVTNWDDTEEIWHHMFYNELKDYARGTSRLACGNSCEPQDQPGCLRRSTQPPCMWRCRLFRLCVTRRTTGIVMDLRRDAETGGYHPESAEYRGTPGAIHRQDCRCASGVAKSSPHDSAEDHRGPQVQHVDKIVDVPVLQNHSETCRQRIESAEVDDVEPTRQILVVMEG